MKLLAYIISKITNKPRYKVTAGKDFTWSNKSWTHNIFRVYELLFWRKEGIRAEMTTLYDGHTTYHYCHTFEASVALFETKMRELLSGLVPKVKIVYVPKFQSVTPIPQVDLPFYFAIAFDAASSGDGGIATTNTYSHTCTGSNLTLTTHAMGVQSPIPTITATYNAVSMTQSATVTDASTSSRVSIFTLASPSTGANNVVTTTSASARNYGGSISMTGTDSSPAGASNSGTGSSTTPSIAVTTGTANSWVVNAVLLNGTIATLAPSATGTNQTSRFQVDHVAGGTSAVGSTQTTTTTGSYTSSWSLGSSVLWVSVVLEIKPLATPSTATGDFMRMGMGF